MASSIRFGFNISRALLSRVRARVAALRGPPHNLTLNTFVALALEHELARSQARVRLDTAQVRAAKTRMGEQ